jgi:hypothetical protein
VLGALRKQETAYNFEINSIEYLEVHRSTILNPSIASDLILNVQCFIAWNQRPLTERDCQRLGTHINYGKLFDV